jgi:hypothetical protein
MFPFRPTSDRSLKLISCRTVIFCVAALALLARYSPPSLSPVHVSFAVRLHPSPAHGQYFDHDDSPWVSPVTAALVTPLPTATPRFAHRSEPLVEITANGWHYNRPPPNRTDF